MNSKNEIKNFALASAKSVKTSIQKANLILKKIRGKKAETAINLLEFSNKKASSYVLKVLKSAVSNAENNHQLDIDKLFVREATVGRSMVLKRFRPRARGRSGKILKPFSKIRIIVEEKKDSISSELPGEKNNAVENNNEESKKKNKSETSNNQNNINKDFKGDETENSKSSIDDLEGKKDGSKN